MFQKKLSSHVFILFLIVDLLKKIEFIFHLLQLGQLLFNLRLRCCLRLSMCLRGMCDLTRRPRLWVALPRVGG